MYWYLVFLLSLFYSKNHPSQWLYMNFLKAKGFDKLTPGSLNDHAVLRSASGADAQRTLQYLNNTHPTLKELTFVEILDTMNCNWNSVSYSK